MKADSFLDDDDAQATTSNDDPSSTYLEFNSRDHTSAYNLASDGGAIRGNFSGGSGPSVHDFYAQLTVALGPLFEEGDKVPMLEFLEPTDEEVREYLDSNDSDGSDDDN